MKYPKTHYENALARMGITDDMFTKELLDNMVAHVRKTDKFAESAKTFISNMYIVLHEFKKAGKKVFRFNPDLCLLLNNTNLKKVASELLNFPFSALYITGFDVLNMRTPAGDLINCMYVAHEQLTQSSATWICNYVSKYGIKLDDTKPVYSITFTFAYEILSDSDKFDQFVVPFHYHDGDIFDIIKNNIKLYKHLYNAEHQAFLLKLIRFALNCILYLTSDNILMEQIVPKDTVSNKKSVKKIRKAISHSGTQLPYSYVGRDIIIDNKDREFYTSTPTGRMNLSRTARWMVRGHWNSYWINKENADKYDKKLIKHFDETKNKYSVKVWLKPYIKGDDLGTIIEKQYVVK